MQTTIITPFKNPDGTNKMVTLENGFMDMDTFLFECFSPGNDVDFIVCGGTLFFENHGMKQVMKDYNTFVQRVRRQARKHFPNAQYDLTIVVTHKRTGIEISKEKICSRSAGVVE